MAQGANAIRSHLAASKYFEDQNIQGTFLELSKLLVLHQPENAQRFMYAYLGSQIGAEDTTPSVVVPDAFSDTCLLRVHASYEGPDGKRKKTFTRLVSSVDKMIRYDVEQQAAREVHSVFWPNDRLTARPLAEKLSAIHVDPTSVDVIAAVEKFLDFCHNRMYLRSQTLESLFGAWDTDQSRDLSMEEMKVVCQENAVPIQGDDHLRSIFEHLRGGRSGGIGLEQLRQTLDLHAQRRQLADLLRQSTDLAWLIARHVLPSPYDTIASLRKVGTAALRDRVSNIEPDILAAVVSVFDVVAHADQQTSEQQQCKQRIDEVEKAISDLLLELDQEPHLQQSTQDTQQPPNTAASTARPTTTPPTPLPQSVTPPTAAKPVNTAARPSERAAAPAAACSDTLSDTDIHSPSHRTSNPVEDYNMRVSAEDKRQLQLQALKDQLAQLKVREKLSHGGGGSNDKFAALAQDSEGLVQAQFGDTNLFLNLGLVGLVGWPSADILRAMRIEHASSRKFKAGNYPGERTPSEEFEFVWDPVEDKVYPHERVGGATEGRERKRLEDLMQLPDIVASKATKEEVLALRLFTGAMYAEYNPELRNALTYYLKSRAKGIVGVFDAAKHAADEYAKTQTAADEADATANKAPSDKNLEDKARFAKAEAEKSKAAAEVADKAASNVKVDELCNVAEALGLKTKRKIQGEERKKAIVDELRKLVADLPSVRPRCLYVTTLHMANSCIIKLASVLKCPEGRKVFRGFSGMRVPEFFYMANVLGFRGGVEPGFMSTSTRKSVAFAYSTHGLKPIFLELEVGQVNCGADVQRISQYPHEAEITFPPLTHIEILHEGRVEEVDGRPVLVMSGKLSVNIKSLSREQLVAQRKENLLAAFGHQVFEIEQSINQKLDDCIQVKGLKETDQFVIWGREVVRLLMEECEKTVQRYRDIEPEDFNTDDHVHELALQEVAALPTAAAAKFGAFLDGQSFQPGDFDVMSMDQWAALRVTTRWHNYQEEAEVKDPPVGEGGSKGQEAQEEAEVKAQVVGGGSKGPETQEEAEVKAPVVGQGDSKGPETQEHVDEGGAVGQRGTSAHKWIKTTGVDGAMNGFTSQGWYVSITHMQEYQDFSCEELRVQDYEAGRRVTPEGKAQAAEAKAIWKAVEARAKAEAEAKAAAEKVAVAKAAAIERRREVAVRLAQARGLVSMPKGVPSSYLQQIVRERHSLDATWGAEMCTALMRAVVNTHLADVKLLLDALCNIEATDANGRTALAYCMIYGRDDMARELLARGASIQTLTKHKQSLVFLASRFGHTRVLETVLSQEGGRELLRLKDSFGESALHIAAEFGHSAVVEVLVKEGGRDFLFVKKGGETCLHVAAQEGRSAVVEVLVKEGGRDLLVCLDKNGASALYIAAQEGHLSVVELLVNECVKEGGLKRKDFELMLKKDDGKGASALSIASEEGHPAVEEVLVKACEKYGLSETEIRDLWRTGAKNGKQQRRSREIERVASASKNIEMACEDTVGVGAECAPSVDVARLPEITQALYDPSEQVQEEATREFRKLLSIERNPPIQQVISAGVVPRIVEFLTKWQCPTLQFEAAWALTNISSGTSEHTHMCVEKGAVPMLVQLLNSPNDDVREQAVWALGNIAGDSAKLRDEVLNHNALMPLLRQLDPNTTRISMLRQASWTLSNFCRGKPQPPFELVKPALLTLASLVNSNDEEVLTDACWALSYLSDGTDEKIQAVIDAGVCRRLVELLMHQSAQVKTPALRTVGNIVTGDDQQTQHLINCAVLPCLHQLLSHDRKGIRKETCWALSNITAGSKEQLQAVIDHNIIPALVHMLETEDFDIRKECAWAISNATSGGDDLQIKFLVDNGCVPPLVNLLDKPDVRIVSVGLEGIENILKSGQRNLNGDGSNPFVAVVEMCGGVDKIEDLQRENPKIYDLAVKILENYFGVDDDEEKP